MIVFVCMLATESRGRVHSVLEDINTAYANHSSPLRFISIVSIFSAILLSTNYFLANCLCHPGLNASIHRAVVLFKSEHHQARPWF